MIEASGCVKELEGMVERTGGRRRRARTQPARWSSRAEGRPDRDGQPTRQSDDPACRFMARDVMSAITICISVPKAPTSQPQFISREARRPGGSLAELILKRPMVMWQTRAFQIGYHSTTRRRCGWPVSQPYGYVNTALTTASGCDALRRPKSSISRTRRRMPAIHGLVPGPAEGDGKFLVRLLCRQWQQIQGGTLDMQPRNLHGAAIAGTRLSYSS